MIWAGEWVHAEVLSNRQHEQLMLVYPQLASSHWLRQ
jgi:hypothetical protein